MRRYLVMDIGCIECGENSKVVGNFVHKENAVSAVREYYEGNEKEWGSEHNVEIFEVEFLPEGVA